jgi:hypothetical protein
VAGQADGHTQGSKNSSNERLGTSRLHHRTTVIPKVAISGGPVTNDAWLRCTREFSAQQFWDPTLDPRKSLFPLEGEKCDQDRYHEIKVYLSSKIAFNIQKESR